MVQAPLQAALATRPGRRRAPRIHLYSIGMSPTDQSSARRSPASRLTSMRPPIVCWNASGGSTRPAAGTSRAPFPAPTGWPGGVGMGPGHRAREGAGGPRPGQSCPPSTRPCARPGSPTPRSAPSPGWRLPRTRAGCWRWRWWQPRRSLSGSAGAIERCWTRRRRRSRRSARYTGGCCRGGWSSWSWCLSPTRRIWSCAPSSAPGRCAPSRSSRPSRGRGRRAETAAAAAAGVSAETPWPSRADGAVKLAESFLAGHPVTGTGGERFQVMVHLDQEVLGCRWRSGRPPWRMAPAFPRKRCGGWPAIAASWPWVETGRTLNIGRRAPQHSARHRAHPRARRCLWTSCAWFRMPAGGRPLRLERVR